MLTPDLQGWGRTRDIDRTWSFQQFADDVATLMQRLGIDTTDFFGLSYSGLIATLVALRYPRLARRIATYGATFGPPEASVRPEMLAAQASPTHDSRAMKFLREGY